MVVLSLRQMWQTLYAEVVPVWFGAKIRQVLATYPWEIIWRIIITTGAVGR